MDNSQYIEKIIKLYFQGYTVEQALKVTKNQRKQDELKEIAKVWEDKAKKVPVTESRGWKFQQAKLI